jgi:hypothetical protein
MINGSLRESLNNEEQRRALEALRNGVPNRDAVRVLGCSQTAVVERFRQQLMAVEAAAAHGEQAKGMLVSGDFGSGKSHLLQYLQHVALEANFVCSHLVVSKETPLYDPAKVFQAAVDVAVAPGVTGQAIQEIALQLRQDTPAYAEFFRWADQPEGEVSALFPATLLLHERLRNDPDLNEKVRGFWAGEKLGIAEVRAGMRQIGQASTYHLRVVPAKLLPLQRFKFASRMLRAAGYSGWVLFIDEVELIAKYSRLQRGRSYAELTRWLGNLESEQYAGLTAVAAITSDFGAEVLERKEDDEKVVPFLQSRDTDEYRLLASRAETGMRIIRREGLPLVPPDEVVLKRTYETLKQTHAEAYDWQPPDVPTEAYALTRRMRTYVRRWINEWDLRRLYPGQSLDIQEKPLQVDYTESPELQQDAGDPTDDPFGTD